MTLSRRTFLTSCVGLALTGIAGAGYMRFLEPRWLKVSRHSLTLGEHTSWKRPMRLLHLSDFHLSPAVPLAFIRAAIEQALTLEPELICITGDFVTRQVAGLDEYQAALAKLSARAPTLAILGNHDGGRWADRYGGYKDTRQVEELLAGAQISCLKNSAQTIEIAGQALEIVGLGDVWAKECDPAIAFSSPNSTIPRIVLSHNPDSKEQLAEYAWDVMLCGHTHGGQLRIPAIGTPFAPVLDQNYVYGLKPWRNRHIHITSGVGNLHGMRLNCRPEIALLSVS